MVAVIMSMALLISLNLFASETIHFAVIGDFGKDTITEAHVAALVARNQPQFIITVGDNNYPDGCKATIDANVGKYFHAYIYNYRGTYGEGASEQRFFPTLGNHDWYALEKCPEKGTLPYFHYFDLPGNERYYQFKKGPVHFFALDSDPREPDGNRRLSRQYQWLTTQAQLSNAPFKIAYFHHSPFSSGEHGNFADMQWRFHDLDIDVVISGHDHTYERIHQEGVIYLVNGLGGARAYKKERSVAGSQRFYNEKHGALFVDADEQALRVQFKTHDNEIIDTYSLMRKGDPAQQKPHTSMPPPIPCRETMCPL